MCIAFIFRLRELNKSFETSVTLYQSPQRNISEDLKLQLHCCENLKAGNKMKFERITVWTVWPNVMGLPLQRGRNVRCNLDM
jgi:hypothetical protein